MTRLPQDTIASWDRAQLINLYMEGMSYDSIEEMLRDYMMLDDDLDTEWLRKELSEEHRV